ncbi:MAG: glucose-6-phosphate dehydrogenase [Minisyncoccia bacterium]
MSELQQTENKIVHKNTTEATSFVIFGITGDLSRKKLIPALWRLYEKGYLPKHFHIVGFSRRPITQDELRAFITQSLENKFALNDKESFEKFLSRCSYVQGNFNEPEGYTKLREKLEENDQASGICGNKLFHLSVPPHYYGNIFDELHRSGLAETSGDKACGWTRILVEKPFGNDWDTAFKLDQKLSLLFKEEQIFRVDHYLGKEPIQDILTFRFANSLFENLWDKHSIEKVQLRLWEDIGVEGRGAFYDGVGTLRDVGQNHLLQMFALIAMEHPESFTADAIRTEREKILSSLRHIKLQEMHDSIRRGQYEGFLSEPGVAENSQTETYFRIKALVESERWEGVPFYFESGKRMPEAKTEIQIFFHKKKSALFPESQNNQGQNVLTFRIQPNDSISLSFFTRQSGFDKPLVQKDLSFQYHPIGETETPPDAYERVIFDCIAGDQTIFTSTKEVLASWEFITPILLGWTNIALETYDSGVFPSILSRNY